MYFVYILLCRDSSLYTGYTVDLQKRLKMHEAGEGSKYVRSRLPVKLIYSEKCPTKSDALKREFYIKSLSRREKIRIFKLRIKNEK